jgi:hypothetical protein
VTWLSQDSVLLAAVFTAIGALIAVGVQALTGVLQRRQEKVLTTFETRMQLYIQICTQYREASYICEDTATIIQERQDIGAEIQVVERRMNSDNLTYEELIETRDQIKGLYRKLDQFKEEQDLRAKNIRELQIRIVSASAAADLIASPHVRRTIGILVRKITEGGELKYDESYLTDFLKAARKDIGIAD